MTATTITGALTPSGVSPRVVAATIAGNAIEFYDFLCFSFFAVYISAAYFPGGDDFYNLLKTLAVFWSGFLFRPLGGVVIGAYADRAGRRPALLLTIALITLGTAGLALVPSYASIGVAAPILLVVCRIIQGFALGGEVGPASVYLVEAAPARRRGYYASWQLASQGIAVMVGGGVGVGLSIILSKQQLYDWGWRVPFMLCLALIPVAVFLRGEMPETLDADTPPSAPGAGLADNARVVVLSVLLIIGGTVSTYVGNYMSTYAIATLKLPSTVALAATLFFGAATLVFSLIGGWLGDRFGRKPLVLIPRIALALLIVPLFQWMAAAPSATTLWIATIVNAALTAMTAGVGFAMTAELLPKRVRATGFAIAYAVGVSIFGGSTQLLVAWLINVTGNPVAPAWYVVLTSLVTIGAALALPETLGRKID
ncbi:MAG: MFS transporter [Pseudomonadota bacterium]|nr:MFS transporter [Pseudomonadota bacterium]